MSRCRVLFGAAYLACVGGVLPNRCSPNLDLWVSARFPAPSIKFPARFTKFPAPSSRNLLISDRCCSRFGPRIALGGAFSKNSLPAGNLRWRLVRQRLGPPPRNPTVPGVSWRRANSAELAGHIVSVAEGGPGIDDVALARKTRMTRLAAALLFAALVTSVQAQDATYDPPNVPSDIIAPERPRGTPRQRRVIMPDTTPPIAVLPLDPLPEAETAPQGPPPMPVEIKPNPLTEWCAQAANSKTPLCRNVGSPRVQR